MRTVRGAATVAAGWVAVVLVTACSGSGTGDAPSATSASGRSQIPGVGGQCPQPPREIEGSVEGLRLPPGATISEIRRQDPVVQVVAYVRSTPLEVRAWVESLKAVRLLRIEDEVREVEALFSTGRHRVFLRGIAVCQTESKLDALVTPDAAAG